MKKIILMSMVISAGMFGLSPYAVAEHVKSLRGDLALEQDSVAPTLKHFQKDEEPIERDYLQQPPLIPHKIAEYRITLKHNKCLSCHSWTNYKARGATKISQTHFENREGAVMSNVSGLRYFCTQCHVPQVKAKELIANDFEPVDSMRH
ncbi:MAG: nitrate reductase cytochrome c-type subunit [Arenicellales bacterium]